MATSIIFVLGPSGVGKSDLSKALAKKLKYEFYEIDQDGVSGIDAYNLRHEWDEFFMNDTPMSLVDLLRNRAQAGRKNGIILGFSSRLILDGARLDALEGLVRVVYLSGREGQCLDAFLARERETGRGLDALHWAQNNQAIFAFLKTDEAKPHIVNAFDQNGRCKANKVLAAMAGDVSRLRHRRRRGTSKRNTKP